LDTITYTLLQWWTISSSATTTITTTVIVTGRVGSVCTKPFYTGITETLRRITTGYFTRHFHTGVPVTEGKWETGAGSTTRTTTELITAGL
jgi:energy-converting hydrogenase Eha subunit H